MSNSGFKQSLYYGNETSYGSAATIDKPIGIVQSINPTETNNIMKVRKLGGGRDYSNIIPGRFEVNGSFEYYMQDGRFLRQVFGEDSGLNATTDSGPRIHTGSSYMHVLGSADSPGMNSFPSFTLEFTDYEGAGDTGNLKRTYTGCRVNNMTMDVNVDDPLSISIDWIGQGVDVSSAAPTSVTESTKDPYVFYQGMVYATSGTITSETALTDTDAIAEVNSLNFGVNNNAEGKWYVSGTTNAHQTLRGLKELLVKGRDYTGSLELDFASKTMFQRFLGSNSATESQGSLNKYQIVLDFVRNGTIGGVKEETDDYMRVVLENCAFESENIPGAPEDIVTESIDLSIKSAKAYIVDNIDTYA